MGLLRWWNRVAGSPARFLMNRLSSRFPQKYYDRIQMVVVDQELMPSAERFFERTGEALASVASRTPKAYAGLRKDIDRVVLWEKPPVPPYHKFQLAAVVPPRIAFESDILCYAAWLLHASGLSRSQRQAEGRAEEFLASLDPSERTRVKEWLTAASRNGG